MLNQDQINGLNSLISPKGIEAIINNLPSKKSPGPDNFFLYRILSDLERKLTSNTLQNISQNRNRRENTKINLWIQSHVNTNITQNPTKKENYRPIYHMNIEADMVKMSIMLKIIYRLNAIPIKIPTLFL